MAITITDTEMTSDVPSVTAGYREHTAADGFGARILSTSPGRLLTRDGAYAALEVAELIARDGGGLCR